MVEYADMKNQVSYHIETTTTDVATTGMNDKIFLRHHDTLIYDNSSTLPIPDVKHKFLWHMSFECRGDYNFLKSILTFVRLAIHQNSWLLTINEVICYKSYICLN